MLRDDIMVEVRDRNLVRRGQITAQYLKLAATLRDRTIGDWKLTLPGAHPMVAWLSQPGSGIVVSQRIEAPGAKRRNMIANPSFEYGTSGWTTARATLVADASSAVVGAYRGKLTVNAVGFMPRLQSLIEGVVEGQTYTLSAYRADASAVNGRVVIRWMNAGGAQVGADTTGNWVTGHGSRSFATGVAPAGATQAYAWIGVADNTPSGTEFAWDAALFELGELDDFIDDDNPPQKFVWQTLFSGPTVVPTQERNFQNPDGTYIFEGVTDSQLLADARAYPEPSNADVSSQSVANDTRVGRAETVMRYYVGANIGPSAPFERVSGSLREFIAISQADAERGPIVSKSPRFQNLLELLGEIAVYASLSFQLVQRGDALEFEVLDVRDRSRFVRFDIENGTLSSEQIQRTPPSLTRAIVAGQGEGVERTIIERTTSASANAEIAWGRIIESFIDQRDTDDLVELQQSGDEALLEDGFTATNVKVVPTDGSSMIFGRDWRLGDLVTVIVSGQETTTNVSEAVLIVDESRAVVGAGLGDVRGFRKEDALTQRVEDTERRVEKLERTAEQKELTAIEQAIAALVPPGSMIETGASSAPSGWLLCDGAAVSRTTYAALFAAIGTTFGTGDGSTTFNLPDRRGRVGVGRDAGDASFDALGETGGAKTTSHTHPLSNNGWAKTRASTSEPIIRQERIAIPTPWTSNISPTGGGIGNGTNASEPVGVGLGGATDSASASTLQPYLVVNYIIKT